MSLKEDSFKKLRKWKKKRKMDTWEDYEEVEKQLLKEKLISKEPTIKGDVRISGGLVKNYKIDIPQNTRPLTDRMKVRIFDVLKSDIYKKRILDLYAGSGSFGLECLSRGSSFVTFIEASKKAYGILLKNIEKTGFTDKTEVFKEKVEDYLTKKKFQDTFDIIFMDPPYKLYNTKKLFKMEEIINLASEFLIGDLSKTRFKGALIIKHPRRYPIEKVQLTKLKIIETLEFGLNSISILIFAK